MCTCSKLNNTAQTFVIQAPINKPQQANYHSCQITVWGRNWVRGLCLPEPDPGNLCNCSRQIAKISMFIGGIIRYTHCWLITVSQEVLGKFLSPAETKTLQVKHTLKKQTIKKSTKKYIYVSNIQYICNSFLIAWMFKDRNTGTRSGKTTGVSVFDKCRGSLHRQC